MSVSTENTVKIMDMFAAEGILSTDPFRSCAGTLSVVNLAILGRCKGEGPLGDGTAFDDAYKLIITDFAKKVKFPDKVEYDSHTLDKLLFHALDVSMRANAEEDEELRATNIFYAGCITIIQVAKMFTELEVNKVTDMHVSKAVSALDDFNGIVLDLLKEYVKQKYK